KRQEPQDWHRWMRNSPSAMPTQKCRDSNSSSPMLNGAANFPLLAVVAGGRIDGEQRARKHAGHRPSHHRHPGLSNLAADGPIVRVNTALRPRAEVADLVAQLPD